MIPVSIPKCMLPSKFPQYRNSLWLFSALLTPSNLLHLMASFLPPASHSCIILTFRLSTLLCLPLLDTSFLPPLLGCLLIYLLSLSLSLSLCLPSWPSSVCWPCWVYRFLSLLWTLLEGSGSTLPHIYNKNLPFNIYRSSHVLSLSFWWCNPKLIQQQVLLPAEQSWWLLDLKFAKLSGLYKHTLVSWESTLMSPLELNPLLD